VLEIFQVDAVDEDVEMFRLAAHDQQELTARKERILVAVDTLLVSPRAGLGVQHDDPVSALETRIDVQGYHLTPVRVSALLQVHRKPKLFITKIAQFNHNLIYFIDTRSPVSVGLNTSVNLNFASVHQVAIDGRHERDRLFNSLI
jgi:hypothetical protein